MLGYLQSQSILMSGTNTFNCKSWPHQWHWIIAIDVLRTGKTCAAWQWNSLLVLVVQITKVFWSKRMDLSVFNATCRCNDNAWTFVMIVQKVDHFFAIQRSKQRNQCFKARISLLDCFGATIWRQRQWSSLKSWSVEHVPNDLLLILLDFIKLLQ